MVGWTVATWVLTPILIALLGFNGVGYASALIACSVVFVIYIVKKYISFSLIKSTFYPFLAAFMMGIVVYFLSPVLVKGIISLIFMIGMGAALYFLLIFAMAKNEVSSDINLVLKNLKK